MTSEQRYFDRRARRFDRFYDDCEGLHSGPIRGLELAAAVVAARSHPTVLDVGCGPGRVAEAVLAAGAGAYVGVDLSPRMLALAHDRLARFREAELVEGDFRTVELERSFDVVLALGLFDYLEDTAAAAAWLRARCSGTLVASFTRADLLKAPVRRVHYALHGCRVFNHVEPEIDALLRAAGFSAVAFPHRGPRGFVAVAEAR